MGVHKGMEWNEIIIREWKGMEWNKMYLSKGKECKKKWMEWNLVTLFRCFKIKECKWMKCN